MREKKLNGIITTYMLAKYESSQAILANNLHNEQIKRLSESRNYFLSPCANYINQISHKIFSLESQILDILYSKHHELFNDEEWNILKIINAYNSKRVLYEHNEAHSIKNHLSSKISLLESEIEKMEEKLSK